MKVTVKEANIILNALEARRDNFEWYCRKYDENGDKIDGVYDETATEYPEFVAIQKLIAKLGNAEV